ncbi:MAG: hypothetical protein H0T40_15680 [Geodermatophilaceae bacterium]|nr:hypothetical protein [Geodermatophilaceae bacterium]
MTGLVLLDAAGRRRSPATLPGYTAAGRRAAAGAATPISKTDMVVAPRTTALSQVVI